MNPSSQAFQALAANPFAFAGFKSTEPYLQQYLSFALGKKLGHEHNTSGHLTSPSMSQPPTHFTCCVRAQHSVHSKNIRTIDLFVFFVLGPELEAAGFQAPKLLRNSPRHRTCVAEVAK
ncbi:unnamed protein product [Chrysoparadoxa australica]